MRYQRNRARQQRVSAAGIACALSIFSTVCSTASAADLIFSSLRTGTPLWSVRRSGLALLGHSKQHRDLYSRAPHLGDSLLLRGGAEKADIKEEPNDKEKDMDNDDEEEDLDKILESLESEIVEEIEIANTDVADDDDLSEKEEEDESDSEEEETVADSSELEKTSEFDEPLVAPAMMQLYATFGVMMLSKKLDLYSPTVVRAARFAFIGYLVILQLFLLYVRVRAKSANNRTPVTLSNPLSGLVQSQLQGPTGGNEMIKNLASSFLKSESTVLEYDLKQAQSMQGGLIFNMAFMWLLHFKMEQMQPLLINTVSGLINMVYSPLFQVYVLGRNLERPFKNPAMHKYEEAAGVAPQEPVETKSEETTIDALEAVEAEESGDDASDAGENTDQEKHEKEDSVEANTSP